MAKSIRAKCKWLLRNISERLNHFRLNRKFGAVGMGTKVIGKVWLVDASNIFIGKNVKIGPFSRLETYSNYEGKNSNPQLIIGDSVSIQHAVHLYCNNYLEIQAGVLIASGCMITDNNHGTDPLGNYYENQPLKSYPTLIKKGVWLGENVSVLAGSIIGERSIIGANSVVRGEIPDYSVAVGNPARVIKQYNFETKAWEKVNE